MVFFVCVCVSASAHSCAVLQQLFLVFLLLQPFLTFWIDKDSPRLLFLFWKVDCIAAERFFSYFIFIVVVFASCSSFSRCVGRASFMWPCRFQNYWHGGETGWQQQSGCGYRGAKCALACEAEGWVVVPGGAAGGGRSHEEKRGGDSGRTWKTKVGTEASGRSLQA